MHVSDNGRNYPIWHPSLLRRTCFGKVLWEDFAVIELMPEPVMGRVAFTEYFLCAVCILP